MYCILSQLLLSWLIHHYLHLFSVFFFLLLKSSFFKCARAWYFLIVYLSKDNRIWFNVMKSTPHHLLKRIGYEINLNVMKLIWGLRRSKQRSLEKLQPGLCSKAGFYREDQNICKIDLNQDINIVFKPLLKAHVKT